MVEVEQAQPMALSAQFRCAPGEMLARLRTPEMRRLVLSQEASPRLLDVLPPLNRQIAPSKAAI